MSKIEMVKAVSGLVVSVGVGAITSNIIKTTSPQSISGIKKVCIGIGAFVLGCIVCDIAAKYTEDKIDEGVAFIENIKNQATQES